MLPISVVGESLDNVDVEVEVAADVEVEVRYNQYLINNLSSCHLCQCLNCYCYYC